MGAAPFGFKGAVFFEAGRAQAGHFPPAWGLVVILSPPSRADLLNLRAKNPSSLVLDSPCAEHAQIGIRNRNPIVRTGIPNVTSVTFFECQNDNNSRWDFSLLLAKASTKTGYFS